MFDLVPTPVKNLIDTIFNAPLQWVQLMTQMIDNAGIVAGKGITLNHYFVWFGYLPNEWQVCVSSIVSAVVLLATLILVKAGWNMYLNVKASGKWW